MLVGVPGELFRKEGLLVFVFVFLMMAAGWSVEEAQALIEVWGNMNVKSQAFIMPPRSPFQVGSSVARLLICLLCSTFLLDKR